MHRQLTLILALSLLFTVVLPIHVLAGTGVDNGHLNLARAHRMLKKRAENPLAGLLGAPGSQASAGDGGAANVAPPPTTQSQNGNTAAGSTNPTDGSSSTTGSGQTANGGTTSGGNGASSGAGTGTGTGAGAGTGTGSQDGSNTPSTGGDSNTGTTNSNGNAGANQQGNNNNPVGSILSGVLGGTSPTPSSKSADTPAASANSTSPASSSTPTSTKTSAATTPTLTSSSTPLSTLSATPTPTPNSSSNDIKTLTSTTTSAPNSTAAPTDDDSNPSSSGTITRNTIIILVAIGASVGVAAIVWTVIRKWKFRPSSNFNGRMQPINWEPSPHDDDGGIIAERLNRNPSTRSHGSFTSGTGHSGANEGLVSDLPPLDAMAGPNHLAPVGGYANLQRGPSPQPMYELPNPHSYPVSQPQQYYNPGQGSAYGYRG